MFLSVLLSAETCARADYNMRCLLFINALMPNECRGRVQVRVLLHLSIVLELNPDFVCSGEFITNEHYNTYNDDNVCLLTHLYVVINKSCVCSVFIYTSLRAFTRARASKYELLHYTDFFCFVFL